MTTVNRSFIVSVFNDNNQAQRAMNDLRLAGFGEDQIRCEVQNSAAISALPVGEEGSGTQAVAKGVGLGGGIGALLGTGTGFVLRRRNPTIASRPLWETLLEGAGIGTAMGSLLGLLLGRKLSAGQMNDGSSGGVASVLILVEDDHRPQDALDILRRNGATEVRPGVQRSVRLAAPTPVAHPQVATPATNQTATPPTAQPTQRAGQVSAPASTAAATSGAAPSLVVAAFSNQAQAQNAISALLGAGFNTDQIRYSEHGPAGGGILNHLVSLGVPHQEAYTYEREFEMGHTVVTVRTPHGQQEATNILRSQGAYNVRLLSPQPTGVSSATSPSSETTTSPSEAAENLRLREEQLRINKQQVQTGEVDVHREVVSEEKTINVPITREEVVIEHHPISEKGTGEPIQNGETIRIPVSEEEAHVTKQTVQTGEVTIDKRQVQDVQHVTEPVKREELHVERKGDAEVVDNSNTNPSNQEG